jgi:cytoskeleton-associated protein 5
MRFVFSTEPRNVRMCKYVVNMLLGMMSSPAVAARISREHMYPLQDALLAALLDPSIAQLGEGPALSKAMNVVMIKVLTNGEPTAVLVPLLLLLANAVTDRESGLAKARTELILKCLMKLRMTLDKMAPLLDYPGVLGALHTCAVAHADGGAASADYVSMRTLRQLVHDLARVRGRDLAQDVVAARLPAGSPLMPLLAAAGVVTADSAAALPSAPSTQELAARLAGLIQQKEQLSLPSAASAPVLIAAPVTAPSVAAAVAAAAVTPRADTLRDIFQRLSERAHATAALHDLHAFKLSHPDVDLEPYLSRSSTQFREYVHRGLQRVAAGTSLDDGAPAISATLAGEAASRLHAITARLGPSADKENALPRTLPLENSVPVAAALTLDELRLRAKALATAQAPAPVKVAPVVAAPTVNQAVHDLRVCESCVVVVVHVDADAAVGYRRD